MRTPFLQSSLCRRGFSLAEILIAMAIMGLLTAFTVPAVLNSANSNMGNKHSAMTKDAALMVFGAYQQYKLAVGTVPTTTAPSNLTPYMQYVKIDTSGTVIDATPNVGSNTCNATSPCLKLHNGGYLLLDSANFNGSTTLNAFEFVFDPDPTNNTTSTADGPLKALQFDLYYDGKITTRGTVKSNTKNSNWANYGPASSFDPSWFTGF